MSVCGSPHRFVHGSGADFPEAVRLPTYEAMHYVRRLAILAATLAGALLGPAAAHAAPFDPLGFRFSSPVYVVNENAGQAVITITRIDTIQEAQIRYIALPGTAERGFDFEPVKAMINFLPGQASATFSIPIIDHGVPGLAKTVNIGLFGPSPIGMSVPNQAVLTILNNDPVSIVQNLLNPLGLSTTPAASDPLTGARAYVDPQSWYASEVETLRSQNPAESAMMNVIAQEPGVQRFGHGIQNPSIPVQEDLSRAQVRGARCRADALNVLARRRRADPLAVRPLLGLAGTPGPVAPMDPELRERNRRLPRDRLPRGGLADHRRVPVPSRAGGPDGGAQLRGQRALKAAADRRLPRRGRRRRAARNEGRTAAARGRRGPHRGLLPQRNPLRLDAQRDPLRLEDLAPDRRQALRREHRRQRPRAARAPQPYA